VLNPAAVIRLGTERGTCDIEVQDIHLDEVHMVIIRLDTGWLFVETGRRDLTRFNGMPGRQRLVGFDESLVLHLGGNAFVFRTGRDESSAARVKKAFRLRQPFASADAAELPQASVAFLQAGEKAGSVTLKSGSCLFGVNHRCDLGFAEKAMGQVHAFAYWGEDGVYIEDFGSSLGTAVNSNRIGAGRNTRLRDGDLVEFGPASMQVRFDGDVEARAAALRAASLTQAGVRFAALAGSLCEDFAVAEADGSVVVGRGTDANVVLLDSGVSRAHAKLRYENKRVWITDLQSANGVYVNGRQIQTSACAPGDLVDIGNNTYLLHYLV
jgi:pSer/pThr/pTyr-binding forkhead associated (FHA) protein